MKERCTQAICQNSTVEYRRRYKIMKTKGNKAVSKAMRVKTEEALTELQNFPNGMFRLVKALKTDSKEVKGGVCMK